MALLTPHWEALTPKTRAAFHIAAGLPFIQRYYPRHRRLPHRRGRGHPGAVRPIASPKSPCQV